MVTVEAQSDAAGPVVHRRGAGFIRRSLGHPGLIAGAVVFGLIVVAAIAAPLLAPYDPNEQDILNRLQPPVWHHWSAPEAWSHPLGTDRLGRDYLSRLLFGARTSLIVAVVAITTSGIIGTILGLIAGFAGGRVDAAINLVISMRLSLPFYIIALAAAAAFGASFLMLTILLSLFLWDSFAVVVRGLTIQVSSRDYVTAALALGCSRARVIFSEILPNVIGAIVVVATTEMAVAILYEAGLSFLGLGVQPPRASWGLMLSEAKMEIFDNTWLITLPGVCLFVLVLAINLLGDGLRDVLAADETT